VLRTVHLKRRHGYSIGGLVASQLVEKVIEALALAIEVAVVASFWSLPPRMTGTLALFAALTGGGVIAVVAVAWRFRRHEGGAFEAGAGVRGRLRGFLYRLAEGMHLLRAPSIWVRAVLCSFVNDVTNACTVGLALAALGVSLPVSSWFVAVLVARLAGLLPSTPGQFGVVEAGVAAALAAFGIDVNLALAAALLYHLAHFVPVTAVGLWELRRQLREGV
jgi:hypothetical protein